MNTFLSGRNSRLLKRKSSSTSRRLWIEPLEDRCLLAFDPSPMEQEMLEHVNRMRINPAGELDVLFSNHPTPLTATDADVQSAINFFNTDGPTLVNQWASLTPAPPLAWHEALYDAAAAHNQLMITNDSQAHQLPGEAGLLDRIVAAGYDWQFSVGVAENIFAFSESVFYGHAGFVIDWGNGPNGIQSPPGHRDAIMNADFQEVGISVTEENNPGTSVGPLVVTQDFGRRGNYGNAAVLGVVYGDANGNNRYDAGEQRGGVQVHLEGPGGTFTTETMTAGGYQVKVPAGTYTVTICGGGLSQHMTMENVVVGGENVKVDFDVSDLPVRRTDLVGRDPTTGNWWVANSTGSGFTNELWGQWGTTVGWVDVMQGDFDGDGDQDAVGRSSATGHWYLARSNGSSFTNELWGQWGMGVVWTDVMVGDFDGDGDDDIVGRIASTGHWYIARSTGSSFTNELWGQWSSSVTWGQVAVGDFDGDCDDDIVGRLEANGQWYLARSTGSNFTNELWGQWGTTATWVDVSIGDFDGDGDDDIVGRIDANGHWWLARSNGASSFINELWGAWGTGVAWLDVLIGDFDGDGDDDIAGRLGPNGQWWLARSSGSGFANELWGAWGTGAAWLDVLIGDFDGDGDDDIAGRLGSNGQWWLAQSTGSNFANALWGGWSTAVAWQFVDGGNVSST